MDHVHGLTKAVSRRPSYAPAPLRSPSSASLPVVAANERTALLISGETGRTYSFAQLRSLSIAFGQGLKHVFRWSKGDVLAFFSPNDIDTCVLNLGVHWAGGVASPVNPTYTADELAQQLKDSGAKAVVTQKAFLQPVCRAAHAVGLPLENVLLMGEEVDDEGRFRHWKGVTAKGAWIAPKKTPVDPKCDLAYLAYSSVR